MSSDEPAIQDGSHHTGGGYFEVVVDGQVVDKVRGRQEAEAAYAEAAGITSPDVVEQSQETHEAPCDCPDGDCGYEHHEPIAGSVQASESFAGPAMALELTATPDPTSVTVHGPRGPVAVEVDGRSVVRNDGHFGRGRWTVKYLPA